MCSLARLLAIGLLAIVHSNTVTLAAEPPDLVLVTERFGVDILVQRDDPRNSPVYLNAAIPEPLLDEQFPLYAFWNYTQASQYMHSTYLCVYEKGQAMSLIGMVNGTPLLEAKIEFVDVMGGNKVLSLIRSPDLTPKGSYSEGSVDALYANLFSGFRGGDDDASRAERRSQIEEAIAHIVDDHQNPKHIALALWRRALLAQSDFYQAREAGNLTHEELDVFRQNAIAGLLAAVDAGYPEAGYE